MDPAAPALCGPESVVHAARYGLPLVMAIIGGASSRFGPLADLYRRALGELGRPDLPIAVHSPGHIAETDEEAREQAWPHYETMRNQIGRERGWGPTSTSRTPWVACPTRCSCAASSSTARG